MSDRSAPAMDGDVRERNRRVVRMLIGIVATLIVASFLVGIRW
jgi:hypothetical protein